VITEWRLGNFKSVGAPVRLPLKPITVFCGPNSSGKSSVLQSVLVCAQTLASRAPERALVLNGEYVRLGTSDDVVYQGKPDHPGDMTIGFEISLEGALAREMRRRYMGRMAADREGRLSAVSVDVGFRARTPTPLTGTPPQLPSLEHVAVEVYSAAGKARQPDAAIALKRDPSGGQGAAPLGTQCTVARLDPPEAPLAGPWVGDADAEVAGAVASHFLPSRVLMRYNEARQACDYVLGLAQARDARGRRRPLRYPLGDDDPSLLDSVHAALASVIPRVLAREGPVATAWEGVLAQITGAPSQQQAALRGALTTALERWVELNKDRMWRERYIPLPAPLEEAVDAVQAFFGGRVHYLGPLREEPRAAYEFPRSGDASEVGIRGEFTAAALDQHKGRRLSTYVAPDGKPGQWKRLLDGTNEWLVHFGLAQSVDTRESGKFGYQWAVQSLGLERDLDLTNVGVGVSQVLPIIVMALLADEGSVLVFEQPEIHLHPKVQALLADFFIAVATMGKQCIVETHSEYLVNRLRLRVAEADGRELLDRIGLYFVERPGAESRFTLVGMNEYGAIPDWPADFFDIGPDEAGRIVEAGLAKKRRQEGR